MQDYSPSFHSFSPSTVMLLTDLASAPDDKSTGVEYCQKIRAKYRWYPYRYCIRKLLAILVPVLELADTIGVLLVPRTTMVTYGPRSFAVSGPTVWNTLPSTQYCFVWPVGHD